MTLGFRMDEVMTGTHRFGDDAISANHFMEFRVTWGPDDVRSWINPFSRGFMKQPLSGVVTVGGLCENRPCEGELSLEYHKGRIRYEFFFIVDGVYYTFVGEKIGIRPWNLHDSHTTCYGALTETESGQLVSESVTHFRLATLPAFLKSFRFVRS